jgi:hypothetical protein
MRCTDKDRDSCRVEKRGCEGCYYASDRILTEEIVKDTTENGDNDGDKSIFTQR